MRLLAIPLMACALLLAACGEPAPPPKPALWEVTGPKGEHGWLFGTVHAMPRGTNWRTPAVDNAFAKASVLAVEADGITDPKAMRATFNALATTPGLPPLAERIDAAHRPALAAVLKDNGIDPAQFGSTETWAAALTLAQLEDNGDPAFGADRVLLERAGGGMRVVEFEGVKRQLGLFDALPEQEQVDLLDAVLGELAGGEAAARQQFNDWLTGNVAALDKATKQGMLSDPELRDVLLVKRNLAWVDRLDWLLRHGERVFTAVGAAHIPGPDGLAALLEQRGFTVRRIQ